MTVQASQEYAKAALDGGNAKANSGSLKIYSASRPASVEDAVSGTLLVTCALAATAFAASSWVSADNKVEAAASFSGAPFAPAVTGDAVWARLEDSSGNALMDYDVGALWTNMMNQAVTVGMLCYANGNTYKCSTAGTTASTGTGPSGTTAGIADGTAAWDYVGAGKLYDVEVGNAHIQTGVNISAPTLTQTLPAQ